ncbi:MAG TPA: hypothetical protein VKQ06_11740 [Gammaproteobacteria bacterium]|nr:hypothetical protein [Gammaproteobacteria bacterium]
MIRISPLIAVCAMLATGQALAQSQCERPASVTIPDGASATLDDMLEAQTGVREFLTTMETYLNCMNGIIESATDETPAETLNAWIAEYNGAVGEMETVAARFNEERVAYQQANPSQ